MGWAHAWLIYGLPLMFLVAAIVRSLTGDDEDDAASHDPPHPDTQRNRDHGR